MTVLPGSKWVYVGPGDGQGCVHVVIHGGFFETVTTTGNFPSENQSDWSWLGPRSEFVKQFRPATQPPDTQPYPT